MVSRMNVGLCWIADGLHLLDKYGGTLLVSTIKDGNVVLFDVVFT